MFLGFGLGYAPVSFAKKNPDSAIILIEPDCCRFFSALNSLDWSPVFNHKKLILVLNADEEETASVISRLKPDETKIFKTKAQTAHNESYFLAAEKALIQNSKKEEINTNTLEKFVLFCTFIYVLCS